MSRTPDEQLFFEQIREARNGYFVKYSPPNPNCRFSILSLTYTAAVPLEDVACSMEREARHWLDRFPVPVMVSAFNDSGVLIELRDTKPESHLIALLDNDGEVQVHWRLLKDHEIPDVGLNVEYLLEVFSEVAYRTSTDLKDHALQHARQLRIGWNIVFVWAVIVPAVIAVLSFFSPLWLSALALCYSLWKAYVKAMKLLGKWKKSPIEIRGEEESRRMKHAHFHCEQNPEGFRRLKAENFDRWRKEEIRMEAAVIEAGGASDAGE